MPTTSESIYEQLFALTTVMKQRVVDNFSGDALNERWTTRDHSGTGTFAMNDAVDGGFRIQVTTSTGTSQIDFNNIRQFNYNAAELITVWRCNETTNTNHFIGFKGNTSNPASTPTEMACALMYFSNSNFVTRTGDASTASSTEGSVAKDTSAHSFKIVNGSSDIQMTIDGTLDVTKTTNRPTAKLMPIMCARSEAAETKNIDCLYMEVFNV